MKKAILSVLILSLAAMAFGAGAFAGNGSDNDKSSAEDLNFLDTGLSNDGGAITVTGKTNYKRDRAAESGFILRRHEIAVGGSSFLGREVSDLMYYGWPCVCVDIYSEYGYLSRKIRDSYYYKEKVTGTWWLSYTYNFDKLLALGGLVAYDGHWVEDVGWRDSYRTERYDDSSMIVMATFRVSWLNRRIVRMYSSVGAGILIYMTDYPPKFAAQVTLAGISVGKKLYGYAEVGAGMLWFGGCLGIGYRF